MDLIKQNKILSSIRDSSSSQIFFLGPKQYVDRGYRYYAEGRVSHFEWNEDFTALTAKVEGDKLYSVVLSLKKDAIYNRCDCQIWNGNGICMHVISALFTIKNLVSPDSFKIPQDYEHRSHLISSLFDHNKSSGVDKKKVHERGYSIIIESISDNGIRWKIQKDGKNVYRHLTKVPRELCKLAQSQNMPYYFYRQTELLDYLKRYGNLYPIFLEIDDQTMLVKWDGSGDYICKTELNGFPDKITLRRVCLKDNRELKGLSLIGNLMVIDPESRILTEINNRDGWKLWNHYNTEREFINHLSDDDDDDDNSSIFDYIIDSYSDNIDNDIDNYLEFFLEKPDELDLSYYTEKKEQVLQNLIFRVNNVESPLKETEHGYSITIDGDSNNKDSFIIRGECSINRLRVPPSGMPFNLFMSLEEDTSTYLRAKKRRSALYQAMTRLLSVNKKSHADKIIKEVLAHDDFRRRKIRSEAKSFLAEFFSTFMTSEEQILYENSNWFTVKRNKEKEGLLYAIPFELFGWEIFNGMPEYYEMNVNIKELYEKLPLLYQRCGEHNISVFFKGKPITTAKWDFSFDAGRISGIDWFEIRPEIKCNDLSVDTTVWEEALTQKGVIEKDDCIQILDPNSQDILKVISTIISSSDNAKKTDKREVVKVPRLQIFDWISLRNKGVKIKLSPEDESLIGRLMSFEKIEEKPVPKGMKAELRQYQKTGYNWLSFLYEHRLGGCLADDMGLGKTIQAIALMGGIKEGIVKPAVREIHAPHLIVVPTSLLFNWANEIERFYPDLNIHFYIDKERTTIFNGYDLVITTYGIIRRDIERLKDIGFHLVIFDEAQAIKNIYADTTGAARQLKGYFKLTITGTPLENHIGEYYSIFDLSIPGLLGEYERFKSQIRLDNSPLLDLLIRRTRPFLLRRTKEKILKELPPKTETDIYLDLTDKQKVLYQKTVEMIRTRIDDAYHNKTEAQAQIIALTAILKLRQLCVSPGLIDPNINESSPKIDFLIYKVKELMEEGHSALVFSQFTSFLDILEKEL
ncbi:MAG: SNF2-related protein, partial [Nitrospirota bacterium]